MKSFIFLVGTTIWGVQDPHELIRYCSPIYVLCVSSHFSPWCHTNSWSSVLIDSIIPHRLHHHYHRCRHHHHYHHDEEHHVAREVGGSSGGGWLELPSSSQRAAPVQHSLQYHQHCSTVCNAQRAILYKL